MIDRLNAALEDRYRIASELGEGGMASVWLADDLKHERKVAIKVLKPELAAVIGGERFVAEIKTTAGLQHPHILPLFDSGEADAFLYYVMPYVEGETLRDRLNREKQLGVQEALALTKDVADALDYAHRQGVIHRDIKPENILLHDGRPVVADFGIAVAISAAGGGRMTETGLSLGTPHYMSPEQATADRDLTVRSDVYSLACVLYEMLAGDPPHTGPTAQAILVRILTERPRPVSDTRAAVPSHVAAVLMKALEKLPADRFQSAAEFRDALDDTAFTYRPVARTVPEPAPSVAEPTPSEGRTRRSGVMLGVAGTVLAAALAWPLVSGPRGAPPAPDLPVVAFTALDSAGFVLDVEVGPDGTLAYVVDEQVWIRPSGAVEATPLQGFEDVVDTDFSPDGEWLLVARSGGEGGGTVERVRLDGGATARVWTAGEDLLFVGVSWEDDGFVYLTPVRSGVSTTLERVPEVGGASEVLLESAGEHPLMPRLLPGGGGVLLTLSDGSGNLGRAVVVDLADGDTVEVAPEGVGPRWSPTGHVLYVDRAGTLWALPFDPEDLEATGAPVPVLEGVSVVGAFPLFGVGDGGTLARVSGSQSDGSAYSFVLADEEGGREILPIEPTDHPDARVSPDGRYLAYTRSNDISIFDMDRGTTVHLTEGRTGPHNPIWAPDGSAIVYRDDTGGLSVRPVDRSEPARSLSATDGVNNPTGWLEDGTVLFTTQVGQNGDVMATDATSDVPPRPLLDANWLERAPAVSPDGRWIAYLSDRSGTPQIYVRTWPELREEQVVSEGDLALDNFSYPLWAPDGETLYYHVPGGVRAADVSTTGGFSVDSTRTLPLSLSPRAVLMDIHPDGRFLVMEVGAASAEDGVGERAARLIVTANWFTELRERLGGT